MGYNLVHGRFLAATLAAVSLLDAQSIAAWAQEANYAITLRNQTFQPRTLSVKAGVKIRLTVTNASSKSVEFESAELNREQVIAAGNSAVIYIGPLSPGIYPFFDDFNQAARGQIVAK